MLKAFISYRKEWVADRLEWIFLQRSSQCWRLQPGLHSHSSIHTEKRLWAILDLAVLWTHQDWKQGMFLKKWFDLDSWAVLRSHYRIWENWVIEVIGVTFSYKSWRKPRAAFPSKISRIQSMSESYSLDNEQGWKRMISLVLFTHIISSNTGKDNMSLRSLHKYALNLLLIV